MNAYIVVEGDRTEVTVYPKWIQHIAPILNRVDNAWDITDNNYYLFSGGGIPSIYNHIANAAEDINQINSTGKIHIDYLIVCIDTEEETRDDILAKIQAKLQERNILKCSFELHVFEQKVSMESWFLGNRKIIQTNPTNPDLIRYMSHYNVRDNDPEYMSNIDSDEFSTTAQFHHSYLKKVFTEQHIKYSKNKPDEVCQKYYLDRIIERHVKTGHLASFARWYTFMKNHFGSKM